MRQAWHFQYLDRGLRNLGDGGVPDVTPRLLRDRHKGFEYLRLDLCGRRGTFTTLIEVCATLGTEGSLM